MAQERDIKYSYRTFSDFRTQLIEFTKNYFPDTYNDFSPTSPGMMFMEMAAYVGDVLSFYQDTQLQETFLQYARNSGNLYNLAYMMGYRPKVTSVAEVELELTQEVEATGTNGSLPDYSSATGSVEQNSVVTSDSTGNVQFLTTRKVDFSFSSSLDPTTVAISEFDGDNPSRYTLTKKVKAFSGEVKTITQTVSSAEKFYTITIEDDNIIGVLSITDSGDNTWYEVPFLGQETVFVESRNTNPDSGTVYNTLSLQRQPRRFVTRFTPSGQLQIQFGAGTIGEQDDDTFVPTLENVGLGTAQGVNRLDYAFDPSNFLYTRTYGLAPSNTTLTIQYLVGGGTGANVPANTLTSLQSPIDGVTVTNPLAATGGSDGDNVDDLRQNSLRAFNEQGRAVTLQDYNVRIMSLPPSLGSVAKVYTTQDELYSSNSTTDVIIDSNPLSLSTYITSYDIDGKLTAASSTLKENIKTYLSQYIMMTDAVNIKDAFIVNIGIDYEIILLPNAVGRDVLLKCSNRLRDYFSTSKREINQTINLSKLYTLLDRVKGVQTVQNIKITNKVGGDYSQYAYDISGATKNNIVYPSLDPCIFEVKFPDTDIRGKIVTY